MADSLGWRWSFGLQIPLIVVSACIVQFGFSIPHRAVTSETIREKLKKVDFAGAVLLVTLSWCIIDLDCLCLDHDFGVESRWK